MLRSFFCRASRATIGAPTAPTASSGNSCSAPRRFMSSLISVDREGAGANVAVVRMQRPPVNSLNLELLGELRDTLTQLDSDKTCKGIIMASSLPKIFSAGLDINEMHQPEEKRLREFWSNLQDVWLHLYGHSKPTLAAVDGNAPAGGCLLAMSCDYRVMAKASSSEAPSYSIGLNETQLGIVAPFWFQDTLVNTVGHRQSEYLLQLGLMVPAEKALAIGMVDELVDLDSTALDKCVEEIQKWVKIPSEARRISKHMMRGPALDRLRKSKEEDIQGFVSFCMTDQVQQSLTMYLEMLAKRSKKK